MQEPRITILNVNDTEAARYTITRMLSSAGFNVIEAATGEDCLDRLSEGVDVVLLDLKLPDISGFDVCRAIKADPRTSRIPVLHISAVYTGSGDWVRALESGSEAYLSEPVDAAVLVATIRALIRARELEQERDKLLAEKDAQLTELRQTHEALRLSEERFRVALQGSPIVTFNQDLELRYTWIYNELPGWEQVKFIGKTDADIVPEEDLPLLLDAKLRVLAGERIRTEFGIMVGETKRFYDITLEPLFDSSGAIAGLTGAAVDITESRQIESKLREKQRLESIGLLAGGVAHDFNNLLTGVLGNASIVMDELDASHPFYERLAEVVEGSQRAAALTRQLLAYAGKGQFVVEVVDLSRLVRDIVSLIDASIPKLIHLELTLRDSLAPVEADASQLQQLIMNLVINAAEAIGEGHSGTIRINTGAQEISPLYIARSPMATHDEITPGPYVYLEVRDTGCGMTQEVRNRIFDPFFTTKFTGRGLGLAAVRGIVRSHKGTIELYSTPGHGTTFRVLFPATAAARAPQGPDMLHAAELPVRSGTVLVADDESYVRQLARAALERHGFSVLLAEDGNSALDIFEANRDHISAVLLDMTMPGRGGTEVYHILKRERPDLPIILSSGYNEADILRRFPGCDGLSFLQKPYTSQRLIEKVRAAFAGSEG